MRRCLLNEWNPNSWLIMSSLVIYAYLIYVLPLREGLLLLLMFLLLGWSFSFAKPKEVKRK